MDDVAAYMTELGQASLGDGFLFWYSDVNFLHFAALLFLVCAVLMVVVSLLTPPPDPAQISGLTRQTAVASGAVSGGDAHELVPTGDSRWRRQDFWLTIVLALSVGAVLLYFTG